MGRFCYPNLCIAKDEAPEGVGSSIIVSRWGGALRLGDVELVHPHHGLHGLGMAEELADARGSNLPAQATEFEGDRENATLGSRRVARVAQFFEFVRVGEDEKAEVDGFLGVLVGPEKGSDLRGGLDGAYGDLLEG